MERGRTKPLWMQTLTVNETKDEKKVPSSYLDNLDSTPSNTETTWRKSTEKNLNAQCEKQIFGIRMWGFLPQIFIVQKGNANYQFDHIHHLPIKDNILFDRTDGNHWTTAETEIQTQNPPEVGLLSNTTLLPLECMVKYKSVCTRHVFGQETHTIFYDHSF